MRERDLVGFEKRGERRKRLCFFRMFFLIHLSLYGNPNNDLLCLTVWRLFIIVHMRLAGCMLEGGGRFSLACAEGLGTGPQGAAVSHLLLIVETLTHNCQLLRPLFFC